MKYLATLFILLLLITACSAPIPVSGPTPEPAPAATETPVATAVVAPTATAQPRPDEPPAEVQDLPTSSLFDIAWDDRTPFAAGLITAEQGALDTRPGASVYHIDMNISDDLTQIQGRQEVRYTNTEDVALNEIVFRLFPNTQGGRSQVARVTVNGEAVTPDYSLEDSALSVPLSTPLQPGEQVVIAMNFAVDVPTESGGNYGILATVDDILALAHFYPMIAVYDDTGWNIEIAPSIGDVVYVDSSYYLVQIDAPVGQTIATSGVEIDRAENDGRQTITVAAGPMRDFYLVSSDRYERLSEQVGETTINAYAPPELHAENQFALAKAADAFRSYSARFGDYPFTELDVAGTPTLAGGVEYPGIVVVALGIYDPELSFFEGATTHEVGHQWFYSVVGNNQVDEPWLDESLTQYATMLYFGDAYGSAGYDGYRDSLLGRWQRIDNEDVPVGMPVSAYDDLEYSGIVYGRGPLFFEALESEMGEDVFAAFLKDYYQTFKYDIATTESLQALAEQHCGCDLTPLFADWIYP